MAIRSVLYVVRWSLNDYTSTVHGHGCACVDARGEPIAHEKVEAENMHHAAERWRLDHSADHRGYPATNVSSCITEP